VRSTNGCKRWGLRFVLGSKRLGRIRIDDRNNVRRSFTFGPSFIAVMCCVRTQLELSASTIVLARSVSVLPIRIVSVLLETSVSS